MEKKFVDRMRCKTEELGITLSDRQLEQFYQYYEMLVEWNKVMNLTAITEMEEVITKHFVDSLCICNCSGNTVIKFLSIFWIFPKIFCSSMNHLHFRKP